MIGRLVAATALGLAASILPGPLQHARAMPLGGVNRILLVRPYEGHSGDTVYLSGSGFLPNTQLIIWMACPKWDDPHAIPEGNLLGVTGPTTNSHGDFAGWPLRGFHLHVLQESPCAIYANYSKEQNSAGQTYFVCDICGSYYIIRPGVRLRYDAKHITAVVTPSPKRVKSGLAENISISRGWGGAIARVVVSVPHGASLVRKVRLDWKGQQSITIRVDAGPNQAAQVKVNVSFRLGQTTGRSTTNFIVVH